MHVTTLLRKETNVFSLNRETTIVMVGTDEDKREFRVHTELFTRYHQRLFRDLRIGWTGTECRGYFDVYQPIEPKVFIGLMQFAYHGKFFPGTSIDTLWKLYIYAENRDLFDLQDILMNRIVGTYKNTQPSSFPSPRHIQLGYNSTKKDSSARIFLKLCYIALTNCNTKLASKPVYNNAALADAAKNTDDLLLDVLNLTNRKGKPYKPEWDPRDARPCLYHCHAWGTECPNFREME